MRPRSGTRRLPAVALLVLAAACTGPGERQLLAPTAAVTVGLASSPLALVQGRSATATLSVGRVDVDGAVTLAIGSLPRGLSATIAPRSLGAGDRSAALVVTAAADAPPGSYTIPVSGAADRATGSTVEVPVTVTAAPTATLALASTASAGLTVQQGRVVAVPLTLSRGGGFDGAVTLATDALPTGVRGSFDVATVAAGSTAAVLTLSVDAGAPAGSFAVTVRATGPNGTPTATLSVPLTVSTAPVLALTLPTTAVAVTRGAAVALPVTIGRQGFTGDVAVSTESNAGLSGAAITVAAGATTGTLSIRAAADAALGPTPLTVRAVGPNGTPTAVGTVVVTVAAAPTTPPVVDSTPPDTTPTPAPTPPDTTTPTPPPPAPVGSFSLAAPTLPIAVQQGDTSGAAAVGITRVAPFAGAVTLAASGAPAGVSVLLPGAPVAGNSTTFRVATGAGAPVGDHVVTLRGTGSGVPDATATITVRVTAPPPPPPPSPSPAPVGTELTWTFCPPTEQLPRWLAVQDGSGAWTRLTGATQGDGTVRYTFRIQTRGGVAWVAGRGGPDAPGTLLTVLWGSLSELQTLGQNQCNYAPLGGPRTVTGTVAGLGAVDRATIAVGAIGANVFAPVGLDWTLSGLPSGSVTVAASRTDGLTFLPDRVIVRRGTSLVGTPTLDFAGTEAFAPAVAPLTVTNAGSDGLSAAVSLVTDGLLGTAPFTATWMANGTLPHAGLPDARLAAGELQLVTAYADAGSGAQSRVVNLFTRSIQARTLALGAPLGAPTVTVEPGSYLRARARIPAAGDYPGMASLALEQGSRLVLMSAAPGWTGGAPTTWDLTLPDFASVAGWNDAWAPFAGAATTWQAYLLGGTDNVLLGATPRDGTTYRYAVRTGTISSTGVVAARAGTTAPLAAAPRLARARAPRAAVRR